MNVTYIIVGVISLAIGFLVSMVVSNGKRQKLVQETAQLKGRVQGAEQVLEATKQNYEQRLKDMQADAQHDLQQAQQSWEANTQSRIASMQQLLDQQKEHHNQELQNQAQRFDEITETLEARMKEATEKLLKDRQEEFASSSNTKMENIIKPLTDKIKEMKDEMEKTKTSNTETKTSIEDSMRRIVDQATAAQKSAETLTQALQHQPKVQGDWGENILDKLLQAHGLQPNVNYEIQPVLRDDDGKVLRPDDGSNMRPDVILHLDATRDVIIDSKVSLTDYIDYANAPDDNMRNAALDRHVRSIESHVKELADKKYQDYIKPGHTLDFVIMFVPLPQMLQAATNRKPTLWSSAMEKRVFIADEQTLYAALKIISLTWKQVQQEENQRRLYALAGEMLDRVGLFLKQYTDMGNALEKATQCYKDSKKKLLDQGQSIPVTARNMMKLGADYKKGANKISNEFLNPDTPALAEGEEAEEQQ